MHRQGIILAAVRYGMILRHMYVGNQQSARVVYAQARGCSREMQRFACVGGSYSVCFLDGFRLWSELLVFHACLPTTSEAGGLFSPPKTFSLLVPRLQPLHLHASSIARPSPCWCCFVRVLIPRHLRFDTAAICSSCKVITFGAAGSPLITRNAHLLFPPHRQILGY
jgi:hypothetical protein